MSIQIVGRVQSWVRNAGEAARLMVGVQDYSRYVDHMRLHHPELPVLDEAAYVALMQRRRYGGAGISKCPC